MSTPSYAHGPSPVAARIGDADRTRTATVLSEALAAGCLTLQELDERLAQVWSARTAADLRALVADLPREVHERVARREAAERARRLARASLAAHVRSYVAVMALLVAIWLTVGVSGGGWYPWPVWPALGWGLAIASHARAAARSGNRSAAVRVGPPWHPDTWRAP